MNGPSPTEVIRVARSMGLSSRRAVRVTEGGSMIATYLLDDEFIVRFALDAQGTEALTRERSLLERVTPVVDLAVPAYEFEDKFEGRLVAAYRKIKGVSGETLRPHERDWPGLARQLGVFLTAIHSIDARGLEEGPVPVEGEHLADLPRHTNRIEAELGHELTDEMRRYLRGEFPMPSAPARLAFCHADIKGEHLLVEPSSSRLAGVIDWGDAGINDPAIDLGGLVIWLGPSFARRVLEHYEPRQDEAFFVRSVTLARMGILAGIGATLAGEDNWPLDLARRQLVASFETSSSRSSSSASL